ncbi:glucose PTS transporter subunit EIIB [Carnobacterium sp.]|uniref:glucose PTS transporter subunit EIIB n=1 Tax=Carnobacterium sp. TaxID=48221 RepID=UPI0037C0179B
MTGLGFMVMALLTVKIGNTDGGILDFLIFGVLQGNQTKWYLVLLVGAAWFAIYYFVFKFAIEKFNLKTPGRELVNADNTDYSEEELGHKKKGQYDAPVILSALGGADNIASLDNCVTRLRLVVNSMDKVDEDVLKANGALGVMKLDDQNLQVIIGMQVATLKNQLERLI